MKRKILLTFLLLSYIVATAQNYSHDVNTCSGKITCTLCYGSGVSYGYRCPSCGGTGQVNCYLCRAYNYGANLVEQYQQKQWDDPNKTFGIGVESLANCYFSEENNVDKAFKYMQRSAELGNASAMSYLGTMYELGIGVSCNRQMAKYWYTKGVNKNNLSCKQQLDRISNDGFAEATEETRQNYYRNVMTMYTSIQQASNSMFQSGSSNSSSSSERRSSGTCSLCNGTGVDPTQSSGGNWTSWVAHYNSNGNKCPYCGRYNQHYHTRCPRCNIPRN